VTDLPLPDQQLTDGGCGAGGPGPDTGGAGRARVVAAYDLSGTRHRGDMDDLVSFAAELCGVPVALVTAIDGDHQRFLAAAGTDLVGTASGDSFCAHALGGSDLLQVPDTAADPRFADSPLVTGAAAAVRFYAGAPMVTPDGVVLGTVCVMDMVPRPTGLTDFQRSGLTLLAGAAMARLQRGRTAAEGRVAAARQERALEESELRFRTLADAMPQMVWSTLPDGFHDYYNARWYEFTGVPAGSTDGEAWNGMFHADDQDRAWKAWRYSLATGDPYTIEYRLRHRDGTYRWVLGRALPMRSEDGRITRWFGTCTDIHAQKLALEEREVISQELSHRIKNVFAVISGLVGFAARARPEFAPAATDLRQRITALGRAHDFVRPHSVASRPSARQDSLRGLLGDLFEPYQRADAVRVDLTGDDVGVDDRGATPVALLFHELATNATKYGALSADGGRVRLDVAAEDDEAGGNVVFRWCETGGPRVSEPSTPAEGFGSRLVELSAVRQLGGTVERDWRPEGLAMTVRVPRAALSRIQP